MTSSRGALRGRGRKSINAKINYKQTLSNSKTQSTSRKIFASLQYHWSFSGARYCKGWPEGQVTVAYILQSRDGNPAGVVDGVFWSWPVSNFHRLVHCQFVHAHPSSPAPFT